MSDTLNIDLPRHASDKVKRSMDDVLRLTDDPEEMLRIAILSSSIPIGAAAGIVAGLTGLAHKEATIHILELLKKLMVDGVDAIFPLPEG